MADTDLRIPVDEDTELRLVQEVDAGAVYAAIDGDRDHLRPLLAFVDRSHGPKDTLEFITRSLSEWERGQGVTTFVWHRGEPVGGLGTARIDPENDSAEIGYWLMEALQGQGLMYRCCRAFITHLIEERGIHRVEIRCAVLNTRSRALAERLGFTTEGVLREGYKVGGIYQDIVMYSLLAPEWGADG